MASDMRRFVAILCFSIQTVMAQVKPESLEGVWMGVSHQTITVTSIKPDQTFSGTYFTPSVDVRATFAGKWSLKSDTLTLEYTESDSPVFRVPLKDQNRLELVSVEKIILHTLPAGISVEWQRVKFAPHWSKAKSSVKPVTPPTLKTLVKLKIDDLVDANPLSAWIFYLVDASDKDLFDDKMVDALKTTLPTKAGYYFAISQFEGLWGNGGMQHVLLNEQVPQTQYFLKVVADGYEHYDCPRVAKLIRELATKTSSWMKKIKSLNEKGASDEAFEAIWAEVDGYDDVFEKSLEVDGGAYEALRQDLRQNPKDYIDQLPKGDK